MDDAQPELSDFADVEDRVRRRLGGGELDADVRSFVRQAWSDLAGDDLVGTGDTREAAAALLADVWLWAQSAPRAPGGWAVDLAPAASGTYDVLRVVQPDRPFLVDSVMGELSEAGLEVRALAHPVVEVARDAAGLRTAQGGRPTYESLIVVALAPVGEDRRALVVAAVEAALADVRAAVDDHAAMTALMAQAATAMAASSRAPADGEAEAFLRWLHDDRFVFLGAREYEYPRDASGAYAAEEPRISAATSFGVLRDPERSVLRRASEPAILTRDLAAHLDAAGPLTVAKSNLLSRVHRRAYMDYVGVKRYDADGRAVGETRFVGLFTAEAYEEPVREVPLIRAKLAHVMARVGAAPSAHSLKRLRHIVETYPRDELFQIDEERLYEIATGVLHLYDRPRVRLFARTDPFDRFVSVLMYAPRDRYDSEVRERAGRLLAQGWGGRVSASYPSFSSEPLVRVHYVLGVTPGAHARPDLSVLELQVAEVVRTWRDRFEAAVRAGGAGGGAGAGAVGDLLARYPAGAFPAGYRERNDATEALADVAVVEATDAVPGPEGGAVRVRAFRGADCGPRQFRFKLYREGQAAVPLADVLPILENMGLKAMEEEGYALRRADAPVVWVHEFLLEDERGERLHFADVREAFESAFAAVWDGRTENDGFNRLVLELGVGWRDAALMRALARYRQQSGLDPSSSVVEAALRDHPAIARLILDLFRIRLDPAVDASAPARAEQAEAVWARIQDTLQGVASLDADRALRRLALLVRALKRTNFHQRDAAGAPKPYISFKVASSELEDLPAPKPYREIFVSSPMVEGVHLRFGPVARGGLRWSDRRDDFRTEVLGLVKAQQVKNAVIVPVGSKGGFFPKQLPRGGSPEQVRAEGVRAYKTFLSGLLDLTDNLDASGGVVHPPGVVRAEGDDPYLVVAADKGTATFSDIANGVARDYGYWLDDAFASGGSHGYDHKAMGITARGCWEAVKRHFREMGRDIQSEPFTTVGVGDMSGDVFGNGALLSRRMKLVAAFDHRHVFLDPAPDPAAGWAERARLFALPRSSWDDYDRTAISAGGGVWPRAAKSIPLSPQVRELLGMEGEAATPVDLIRAILKAPADLLYLGGIGTYVKALTETTAEAGDKANDPVRVDAGELRVKVVGEGANLGLTQAARIAYARAGGRINTDAIDNSAGVDTSDHEVNIKILLGQAIADGALPAGDRDPLLASMTDEVAVHVLAHNHAQTLALSLQEREGSRELDAQARFMADLVAAGRLDRRVEGLPGPAALLELRAQNRGLTRPELAVLLAYGKLELSAALVAGTAPDDPYFERTLEGYFPRALAPYAPQMRRHRLRREIVATVLANRVVDWAGPTFVPRLQAATGADASSAVGAFEAARRVFRLEEAWSAVTDLDGRMDARAQLDLYAAVARAARAGAYGLLRRPAAAPTGAVTGDAAAGGAPAGGVQALVDAYLPAADALVAAPADAGLSGFEAAACEARVRVFLDAGAPELLARRVGALAAVSATVEAADLARTHDVPVERAARTYAAAGAALGLDRLGAAAASLPAADPYERAALRGLVARFAQARAELAGRVLASASPASAPAAVAAWLEPRALPVERARRTVEEIEAAGGGWSFAKLSIAEAALRQAAG